MWDYGEDTKKGARGAAFLGHQGATVGFKGASMRPPQLNLCASGKADSEEKQSTQEAPDINQPCEVEENQRFGPLEQAPFNRELMAKRKQAQQLEAWKKREAAKNKICTIPLPPDRFIPPAQEPQKISEYTYEKWARDVAKWKSIQSKAINYWSRRGAAPGQYADQNDLIGAYNAYHYAEKQLKELKRMKP